MEADDKLSSMTLFGAATRAWFADRFGGATDVQARGWAAIARGAHALLVAPTGSGKTLAAFLWAIDRLSTRASDAGGGTHVVYVSPLKALVYDIERNLRVPLAGIQAQSRDGAGTDPPLRALRVDVRTGDTTQRERARQARAPGEILVTTPESLYLMLGSNARAGTADLARRAACACGRRTRAGARHLARDLSGAARAHPRRTLHHCLRQQPRAVRAPV